MCVVGGTFSPPPPPGALCCVIITLLIHPLIFVVCHQPISSVIFCPTCCSRSSSSQNSQYEVSESADIGVHTNRMGESGLVWLSSVSSSARNKPKRKLVKALLYQHMQHLLCSSCQSRLVQKGCMRFNVSSARLSAE